MSNKEYTFSFENEEMIFFVDENIAILKLKNNILTKISDIEKSGKIITVIDWVEKDPVVDTLLIFNEEDAFSEKAYCLFMDEITKFDKEGNKYSIIPEKKLLLVRQIHSVRILINKLLSFEKNVIFCLNQSISTLGFTLSLAGDYRFASNSVTISFPNKKYNFPPVGGLPFLLERYIGQQETSSIMFHGKSIEVETAKDLKLINEIFSEEGFESKCILETKELAIKDEGYRKISKRLINYYHQELEDYFSYESKISGF